LFAADAVRVDGTVRLDDEAVRRLGGVDIGTNVAHLDAESVERGLLRDPRIASATVTLDPPDLVIIRIDERIPVATTDLDGAAAVVADDGAILPGEPSVALPEIHPVGGELSAPRREAAARALGALPPVVRRSVATVFTATGGELVLETSDRVTVTYGPAVDIAAKGAALRAVLEWARDGSIQLASIDVTVSTAPTVRTADGRVSSI
jgi:cell division protein FtsQ